MRCWFPLFSAVIIWLVALTDSVGQTSGQLGERAFVGSLEHPAIQYTSKSLLDPIAKANDKIEAGDLQLTFGPNQGYLQSVLNSLSGQRGTGYLESVLDALDVPRKSQILVFSKTGVQRAHTGPRNPRAFFFNDSIVVGYIDGAPFLELAAHDPQRGVIFYTLDQKIQLRAVFTRRDTCLGCHVSFNSLGVPGMLARSMVTAPDGSSMPHLGNYLIDHRSPFGERWGGWYVTGTYGSIRHMGNSLVTSADSPELAVTDATLNLRSLQGKFETSRYLSPYSDIVALMVFEHQMRMINLLTRVGWEVRLALHDGRLDLKQGPLREAVDELVDYLLFVDEAPLSAKVEGSSGFAEKFGAQGPRDSKGRSLRQLDLVTRLMRHPCSYMIYTEAFDALPVKATDAIYQRMWQILSARDTNPRYARLSGRDRRAIVEILRETKRGLPAYFQ